MSARSPQRPQLMELLEPVIADQGYDLEDLSVTAAGRRSLIRVIVDGDDGIDLDGIASVARAISEALDQDAAGEAAFAGPYVLEVSSPGVDRPITEQRHWRRAAGRLVTVPIASSANQAPDPITGRVVAAGDLQLVLEVDGTSRHFDWQQVGIGRVQVEFSRPGAAEPEDTAEPEDDAELEDEEA